jgi:hypothetical protein
MSLQRKIEIEVARERERCATIIETLDVGMTEGGEPVTIQEIRKLVAAAIRLGHPQMDLGAKEEPNEPMVMLTVAHLKSELIELQMVRTRDKHIVKSLFFTEEQLRHHCMHAIQAIEAVVAHKERKKSLVLPGDKSFVAPPAVR